ncbi:phage holin family protein [Soehngenia saccharolytica]|nr:phage holin family protein [Tissierellales bacterium]TJX68177.1 phage holin family protein [Soehngenia saccharolytica]
MSDSKNNSGILDLIVKIIVSAVVLGITAFFTPGFSTSGIGTLILAAIVIGVLNWVAVKVVGVNASPFGAGAIGFIVTALVLYLTRYFVDGYNITILGAIIGALVLGIVDALLPGRRV